MFVIEMLVKFFARNIHSVPPIQHKLDHVCSFSALFKSESCNNFLVKNFQNRLNILKLKFRWMNASMCQCTCFENILFFIIIPGVSLGPAGSEGIF